MARCEPLDRRTQEVNSGGEQGQSEVGLRVLTSTDARRAVEASSNVQALMVDRRLCDLIERLAVEARKTSIVEQQQHA